jgi:hypothetical protein
MSGQTLELGATLPSDQLTFIDFHARAGSDFDARIVRNAGANGTLDIRQEGTGGLFLSAGGRGVFAINSEGSVFRVIPGGSTIYQDFACRAWVNAAGRSTNGPATIYGAGNFSSVTRNSAGHYSGNLSSAMPDDDYSAITGQNTMNTSTIQSVINQSSTVVTVFFASNGYATDPALFSISIHR